MNNRWNFNDGDFYCHHIPDGPAPKDQIIIVIFLIFVVTAITTYQYHSRNKDAQDAYKEMENQKS